MRGFLVLLLASSAWGAASQVPGLPSRIAIDIRSPEGGAPARIELARSLSAVDIRAGGISKHGDASVVRALSERWPKNFSHWKNESGCEGLLTLRIKADGVERTVCKNHLSTWNMGRFVEAIQAWMD